MRNCRSREAGDIRSFALRGESGMSNISIRPLTPEEANGLAQATVWVNDLLERGFRSDVRLAGRRSDIPTLHSLLSKGPFGADPAAEWTTFGTVFGEILANEVPLKWVVFNDENGSDFALQYQDLALFAFPLDMIVKRVENGEHIEAINLETMLEEIQKAMQEEAPKSARQGT